MPEGSQLCQEAKTRLENRSIEHARKRGGATVAHATNKPNTPQ